MLCDAGMSCRTCAVCDAGVWCRTCAVCGAGVSCCACAVCGAGGVVRGVTTGVRGERWGAVEARGLYCAARLCAARALWGWVGVCVREVEREPSMTSRIWGGARMCVCMCLCCVCVIGFECV